MIIYCIKCGIKHKRRGQKSSKCLNCFKKDKAITIRKWQEKNPEKIKIILERYRKNHLELCRERTRISQIRLNDKKRFGGNRQKVLERDNYKCQKCNKDVSNKYTAEVHHLNQNKQDNKLENLITLCKSCHHLRNIHPFYWQ